MPKKVNKNEVLTVYGLKRKERDEIGEALLAEEKDEQETHWKKAAKYQKQMEEVLSKMNYLAAWDIRKAIELIGVRSEQKFLKILEICGVEVLECG